MQALRSFAQFRDARDASVDQAQAYADAGDYGFTDADVCSVQNAFASVGLGRTRDRDCDAVVDGQDPDVDGDGVAELDEDDDPLDNCPEAPNPDQADCDDDGAGDVCDDFNPNELCGDVDRDGEINRFDNCPCTANPNQADNDHDGEGKDLSCLGEDPQPFLGGDACDTDDDGDAVPDGQDNCPFTANADQIETDADGIGDACDNCSEVPNENQADNDADDVGDICDPDDDDDGICDRGGPEQDGTPGTPAGGCEPGPGNRDLCPSVYDPQQVDIDDNGIGLRCDDDEAFTLSGDWLGGIDALIRFAHPGEALLIPIAPCSDIGCPDWISEAFRTNVDVSLPFAARVNVVDDRGFVVSSGPVASHHTLRFQPRTDVFYRAGAGDGVGQGVTSNPVYRGIRYFLEIAPPAQVELGRSYSIGITVGSGEAPLCLGDCGSNAVVTIDELVRLVSIALDSQPISACVAGDRDFNRRITIDELVAAVKAALAGCSAERA